MFTGHCAHRYIILYYTIIMMIMIFRAIFRRTCLHICFAKPYNIVYGLLAGSKQTCFVVSCYGQGDICIFMLRSILFYVYFCVLRHNSFFFVHFISNNVHLDDNQFLYRIFIIWKPRWLQVVRVCTNTMVRYCYCTLVPTQPSGIVRVLLNVFLFFNATYI